eukprot:gene4438-4862_t
MLATLRRKMIPKKWSQVYTEQLDALDRKRQEKEEREAREREATLLLHTLLIPGLASYMTLFLTLVIKEDIHSYSLLAQGQLAVRDMINPAVKKAFRVNFLEKIWVS